MIVYSEDPVTLLDASLLKVWTSNRDAQLFKECITAQMNQHYFDAINLQEKATTEEDEIKFNKQAQVHLDQAREIQSFIKLFEKFAGPKYQFHKLKITT